MRLTIRAEVNLRTREIAAQGEGFARELAAELGAEVARLARENVQPGRGPGPHPHISEHVDTGALAASIKVEPEHRGFLETARVYTDLKYGLFLESGFMTRNGRRVRYPWLFPAFLAAQNKFADIARSTGRRWFSETGNAYRGRVNFEAPLTATLPPPAAGE